jgi:hypothetical protein
VFRQTLGQAPGAGRDIGPAVTDEYFHALFERCAKQPYQGVTTVADRQRERHELRACETGHGLIGPALEDLGVRVERIATSKWQRKNRAPGPDQLERHVLRTAKSTDQNSSIGQADRLSMRVAAGRKHGAQPGCSGRDRRKQPEARIMDLRVTADRIDGKT